MRQHALLALLLFTTSAGAQDKPAEIKPYDSVVNASVRTQSGIFKLHRRDDKLYYEIPPAALGKEFLLVTQIARTKAFVGYGGDAIDERVVRWVRRDRRVLLEDVDYRLWAEPGSPLRRGIEAANNNAILFAFPVEAEAPDKSPVIEVSKMFLSDSPEFSPKTFLGAKAFDKERCFLDSAHAYPSNIEVESTLTFTRFPEPTSSFSFSFGPQMEPGSATVRMHFSMVALPEQPMRPRLEDLRVGYFTVGQYNFDKSPDRVKRQQFIKRWRLEKKDPSANLSEPIKPITFYIDPATPKVWVPYIKKGVEAWQVAFEEAGFRNGIVALEAPADPNWSPEDARYSVIRWLPSQVRNAFGPSICDPRSGEILDADIHMFHNVLDLLRTWYFVQVGPLDPRCRRLPLPDDLLGELLAMVVTHEVGHSLGLPHNMKASAMYPLEKVRDREWVKTMGHTPTLMDYSRFNYVAQPEDGIDPADLIPKIGPYDKFSIHWGYAPVPQASTPEAEREQLDRWARQQDEVPWLRFSTSRYGDDPTEQTEAVGDADPVEATRLGMKNLQRVAGLLVNATSQYGEPYDDLAWMWEQMLSQYQREMAHVSALIGGTWSRQKHAGQSGHSFEAVPKAKQQRALRFLLEQGLQVHEWMVPAEVRQRLSPATLNRVQSLPGWQLDDLLNARRLGKLQQQATGAGPGAYSPAAYLQEIQAFLWSELAAPKVRFSAPRRALQMVWMREMLNLRQSPQDWGAVAHLQLKETQAQIQKARTRAASWEDRAHLDRLNDLLIRALDPRAMPEASRSSRPYLQSEPPCWGQPTIENEQ
jgi:hypothetical protein